MELVRLVRLGGFRVKRETPSEKFKYKYPYMDVHCAERLPSNRGDDYTVQCLNTVGFIVVYHHVFNAFMSLLLINQQLV